MIEPVDNEKQFYYFKKQEQLKQNSKKKESMSFESILNKCMSNPITFTQYLNTDTKDYPMDDFNNKPLF